MTKAQFIFLLFLAILIVLSTQVSSYSDGPPAARTGAPGELTCFNGYCHNSFQVNSGPGFSSLTSNIPEAGYSPGEIYQIELTTSHMGAARFGFQIIAINPETESANGQLIISDPSRTKIEEDEGRIYINHDTAQAVTDSATWKFDWKAPEKGAGNIEFYWASVAANFNDNRSGDYVYKSSSSVTENPTASIWKEKPEGGAFVTKNQINQFVIQGDDFQLRNTNLKIINLSGKVVFQKNGLSSKMTIPNPEWPKGIYIFLFSNENHHWSQKTIF